MLNVKMSECLEKSEKIKFYFLEMMPFLEKISHDKI